MSDVCILLSVWKTTETTRFSHTGEPSQEGLGKAIGHFKEMMCVLLDGKSSEVMSAPQRGPLALQGYFTAVGVPTGHSENADDDHVIK